MKKIVYISGSVGLGHVQRDIRIARELMAMRKDLEILWLAGHPANEVLEGEGLRLLPECAERDVGTSVIEQLAGGSQEVNMTAILYNVRKLRRYDRAIGQILQILQREKPALLIADEAYELTGGYAAHPQAPWPRIVFMWDFVKVYPGSASLRDRLVTRKVNQGWDKAFRSAPDDLWTDIFLGDLEDVPDERLGWGMMNAREGVAKRFKVAGNPVQFDPEPFLDKGAVRARLGYGPGHMLVCSVGGTSVGRDLLQLCVDAFPLIRRVLRDVRMLVVKGPRMTEDLRDVPEGVEVKGYLPKLYEHFAAADMAIVQGGGTSTLELSVLRKQFLYFPLKGHSEQEINVARKLERNGLGIKCSFEGMSPERLAELVVENIDKPVSYPSLSSQGCRRAAETIAGLIP
jgi:predicted glycosyltransferase